MNTASDNDLRAALARLPALRVAVIGDVMLDRFVHGRVERISPEAPVPVVRVQSQEERLGGAANVAANVAALQTKVTLFGVIGPGEAGEALRSALAGTAVEDGLVDLPDRMTTLKTRILGGGQQITRIDRETAEPLAVAERGRLHEKWGDLSAFDAVIVSDYAKGVVDSTLMDEMRVLRSKGGVVVVDPKQGNFELYRGATSITPNAKEAGEAMHTRVADDASASVVGESLRERLQLDCVLLTRGDQGMSVIEESGSHHLPTESTEVYDVTGAGDTVIAVFTTLLAAGASAVVAARAANHAAGLVIRELGTAVVEPERLHGVFTEADRA